jgi:shikimate kinase
MNPASNLILIGPMGAGKTSIGRRLAERLGLYFVDVDQYVVEHTGVTVPTIFELEGEPGFRRRERQALLDLCRADGQLIATGGGAVLDPANRELLASRGFVVWLRTSVEHQLDRLGRDRTRPLLAAPDRRQRLQELAVVRDPLYAKTCDLAFESDHRRVMVAAERLAALLADAWQRSSKAA